MLRFDTPDGDIYEARTYDEIVEQMASGKLSAPKSLSSYRKATAKRAEGFMGVTLKTESNEAFVKSMVKADLLRKL